MNIQCDVRNVSTKIDFRRFDPHLFWFSFTACAAAWADAAVFKIVFLTVFIVRNANVKL